MTQVTWSQVGWFRLRRNGLVEPFDTPQDTTRALIGVQAQILPAAGISLMHRTLGEVDSTRLDVWLHQERTLLKLWGQRHTLHLYEPIEWPALQASLKPFVSWWERKLVKRDGDVLAYRQDVETIAAVLEQEGTLTRSRLRDLMPEFNHALWVVIFMDLVGNGLACHAGQDAGEGVFAARSHWFPELDWEPPERGVADVSLTRRFFHAYGPATFRDMAYWRSVPLSRSRPWFDSVLPELVEIDVEGTAMHLLADDLDALTQTPPTPSEWPARLLYRFDPLLLAHKDKSWLLLDSQHYKSVWKKGGHIEPVVLVRGKIHGTWRYDRRSRAVDLTIQLWCALSNRERLELERDAERVASYLELSLGNVRWSEP